VEIKIFCSPFEHLQGLGGMVIHIGVDATDLTDCTGTGVSDKTHDHHRIFTQVRQALNELGSKAVETLSRVGDS